MEENKDVSLNTISESFGAGIQKALNLASLVSSFQTVADSLRSILGYIGVAQKYGELFLNFLISLNPELKAIRDAERAKGSFDFFSFFSNDAVLNTITALFSVLFGGISSIFKTIPGEKNAKPLIIANIEKQIELLREIQKSIEENSIKPEELQKFLVAGTKEGSIAAFETLPGHLKNAMRSLKMTTVIGQEDEI